MVKKATKKTPAKKAKAEKKVVRRKVVKKAESPKKPPIQLPGLKLVPTNGAGDTLKLEQVAGEVVALDPDEIVSRERVRQDVGDINELASSIQRYGQIHPITVFIKDGQAHLEAGERRRLACLQLKRPVLAVFVDQAGERVRLNRQIHENLLRKDFDQLEMSESMQRDKRIYEAENPAAKRGAKGGTKPLTADSAVRGYAAKVAQETGVSERKVFELLAVAQLPAKYKKRIEAAKTTGERNQIAQECLHQVRQDRKREQLEKAAAAKRKLPIEEAVADDTGRPEIILHYGDNKDFLIGQERFEVCCTDPPYDRERNAIQHTTRASLNPTEHDWDKLDVGWVLRIAPLLKKGGHLLVFCPLEYIGAYELACKVAELDYRQSLIWVKSNPAPVHRDVYASAVEAIVWATKPGGKPWFNHEQAKAGSSSWNVIQGPTVPGSAKDRIHPTQKPEWLITKLLTTHACPQLDHRVVDPFAGAGTTGVACQKLGLPCTLIESDEEFVKATKLRLEASR